MFGIGVTELGIILVVALLVFGPKRLPELARTLGRGMGEFRRASHELRQSLALDDIQNDLRRDLNRQDAGTIHKPQPPQEPPTADDADETPDPTAEATPHPGELPLGDDHAHHDVPEESPQEEPAAASSASGQSSGQASGHSGDQSSGQAKTATPAHPGLGNVPVSGSGSGSDPADPERG